MKPISTHIPRKRKNRFSAFTLAEVLITLGIIGVVAAITIPSIINEIQDRQFKTAWKKEYSVLNQTIQLIYAEDKVYYSNADSQNIYLCLIQQKLKVIKSGYNCSDLSNITTTGQKLWHANNTWYSKNKNPASINSGYSNNAFIINDGALILKNCDQEFLVDVNGYKAPNTIGRDIFGVNISKDKVPKLYFLSSSIDGTTSYCGCSGGDNIWAYYNMTQANYDADCETGTGWGCSAKYILNQD